LPQYYIAVADYLSLINILFKKNLPNYQAQNEVDRLNALAQKTTAPITPSVILPKQSAKLERCEKISHCDLTRPVGSLILRVSAHNTLAAGGGFVSRALNYPCTCK